MRFSYLPFRPIVPLALLISLGLTQPVAAFEKTYPQPDAVPEVAVIAPTARGVIRPGQTAEIAAGMSGKLTSAPYRPGQYFKKGAVLARFNCTRQEAEAKALARAHQTLTLKHENISELYNAGAAGALEMSIAQSEVQQAAAERDVLSARLTDCVVHAPFSGYVTTQHVAAFETPAVNAPLYSIIRAGSLEVSVIAPSAWMRWLKSGTRFNFTVDETGEQFRAQIIRIGAAVDPVSQTIELTARPRGKVGRTLAGMSGIATFPAPPTKAVKSAKASELKSKVSELE